MSPDVEPVVDGQEVEVVTTAQRRRFPAQYKLRMLREAEACSRPGELGALLRREGLYSSHLTAWKAARKRGELQGLSAKKRGPKPKQRDARDKRIADLEREVKRWRARAERAAGLVEVQEKLPRSWTPICPRRTGSDV